ncbi:MAG: hypothetical protein LBK94_04765 [Prevotellaceae bacterium]|nr:hypothetical protein [Prevotellaceae bacterium]
MSRKGLNMNNSIQAAGAAWGQRSTSCMSRELPTVFHVIDSAPRGCFGGGYISTNILSVRDKIQST